MTKENVDILDLDIKFINAVHQVETGGGFGAIRGSHKELGPLQITKGCWMDANVEGGFDQCADLGYSVLVMTKYLNRYAKDAIKTKNFEILSRIWNGGPKGMSKPATEKYWLKVKRELEKFA